MSWEMIECCACKTAWKKFNIPENQTVVWMCASCGLDYRIRALCIPKSKIPSSVDDRQFAFEEGSRDELSPPLEALKKAIEDYPVDDLRGGK